MPDPAAGASELRTGLADGLRAARTAEREVFAALGAAERDAPAVIGAWSAKDVQAHLAAWRALQVERLAALREGRDEAALASPETDAINAVFQAERADWTWNRVVADADATTEALLAEIAAADEATLTADRITRSTMGRGPEHSLAHLPVVATLAGSGAGLVGLAESIATILDRGHWPPRSAAFARYNLACFYALSGQLEAARGLLREALPGQEELQAFAPDDDDLIALRDEIPALIDG